MVPITYRQRLGALCALATVGVLSTLTAPASALTVTIPTLPAPLPVQLPVGGSVSTGTGGDPLGVTVTLPGGSGVEVEAPGLPTLPIGPTGPVPAPLPTTPGSPVISPTQAAGSPEAPLAPQPRRSNDPSVATPGGERVAVEPSAPISGAQPVAGAAAPAGLPSRPSVDASINARPASDSLLHRVPAIATHVALWAALAAIVFVLQMLVGSAVREHRRKAARVS